MINLIVQTGLEPLGDVLENVRKLVKKISKSSNLSKIFFEVAQKNFHLDVKRKLNIDMKVRWNSTFKMIDNALFYKDVLIHLGLKYASIKIYVPSDSEWEKLVAIHKFLKIFYDVTCMFSAVKTPTSNLYFKGAWLIHCHLLRTKNGPPCILVIYCGSNVNKI